MFSNSSGLACSTVSLNCVSSYWRPWVKKLIKKKTRGWQQGRMKHASDNCQYTVPLKWASIRPKCSCCPADIIYSRTFANEGYFPVQRWSSLGWNQQSTHKLVLVISRRCAWCSLGMITLAVLTFTPLFFLSFLIYNGSLWREQKSPLAISPITPGTPKTSGLPSWP